MLQQTVDPIRLDFLAQKPVVVQSRAQPISADAGLLPIRQFDECWGYTRRLAGCRVDRRREPEHSHEQMTRQRLYGILADYADCNDHDTLRDEPPPEVCSSSWPTGNRMTLRSRRTSGGRRSAASRTA